MELELKDYLEILKKRLKMILAIVLGAALLSALVSYFFLEPVYQASTKIIVNKTNDQVGMNPLNTDVINVQLRLIDTYKEIIKTPAIMDIVSAQHPELGLTSEQLIAKIKVSSVNNTQVMTLAVQDASYDRAMKTVNTISNVFKQEIPKIMKVDNVSILNEAKSLDNPVPVKPNKTLNMAIAIVLGLMASIGLAFLLEYFDDSVKSEADIQLLLDLPILAVVPKVKEEDLGLSHAKQKSKAGARGHVTVNQ